MRQEIFYTFLCVLYIIYAFLALIVVAGFRVFKTAKK